MLKSPLTFIPDLYWNFFIVHEEILLWEGLVEGQKREEFRNAPSKSTSALHSNIYLGVTLSMQKRLVAVDTRGTAQGSLPSSSLKSF